jgi:hypothetical protein
MKNSSTTGGYADDVIENSFGTEVSFFVPIVLILKVSFFERKLKIIRSSIIMMESRTSVFQSCFNLGLFICAPFTSFKILFQNLAYYLHSISMSC